MTLQHQYNQPIIFFLFVCSCLLIVTGAYADKFHLSETSMLEGVIVHEDTHTVCFQLDGAGTWTLWKDSLLKIERESEGEYWFRVGEKHARESNFAKARECFLKSAEDPATLSKAMTRVRDVELLNHSIQSWKDFIQEANLPQQADQGEACKNKPSPTKQKEKSVAQGDKKCRKPVGSSSVVNDWTHLVERPAKSAGIDPRLVCSIIQVESSGNPKAVSSSGAMGLMQLMPKTAAWLGVKNGFDAEDNIKGGIRYLAHLHKRYEHLSPTEQRRHVLAAYRIGPSRLDELGDYRKDRVALDYIRRVHTVYQDLKNQSSPGLAQAPSVATGFGQAD